MYEFSSWNMMESTFEIMPPLEQDAEKMLDPDVNWVMPTNEQDMEIRTTTDDTGEMQWEVPTSLFNASQAFIAHVLIDEDPIYGSLVPIASQPHVPPEHILKNHLPGGKPTTRPSTESTNGTVSSTTNMRVGLRDIVLQGGEHLLPGNLILPEYMVQTGVPVQYLHSLDAKCNGKLYQRPIYASTVPGNGSKQAHKPLEVKPQRSATMATSIDYNEDKENIRDAVSSSSCSVSMARTAAWPEAAKLREYLELQINNITIPVLPPSTKKVGTKRSRKVQKQA